MDLLIIKKTRHKFVHWSSDAIPKKLGEETLVSNLGEWKRLGNI